VSFIKKKAKVLSLVPMQYIFGIHNHRVCGWIVEILPEECPTWMSSRFYCFVCFVNSYFQHRFGFDWHSWVIYMYDFYAPIHAKGPLDIFFFENEQCWRVPNKGRPLSLSGDNRAKKLVVA
jgi:hypothetical protein